MMMNNENPICETTGKICYSKRQAGEIVNIYKKHHKNDHLGRNKNSPRRSYYCSDCGCYHTTHILPYIRKSDINGWIQYKAADF